MTKPLVLLACIVWRLVLAWDNRLHIVDYYDTKAECQTVADSLNNHRSGPEPIYLFCEPTSNP